MNCRKIASVLTLLAAAALTVHPAENRSRFFGPSSGPLLVFTAPVEDNSTAVIQLEDLADRLEKNPPAIRIGVIITENDRTDLPPDIRGNYPEGTNRVIDLLEAEESGAVILVKNGLMDSALIKNGAKGRTTPRWLVETVTKSLEDERIPVNLAEFRLPLYRIGWISEDPLLGAYLRAGIPAVMIETGTALDGVFSRLADAFGSGIPSGGDRHYLVWKIGERFVYAGEGTLVIAVLLASASILFFLFIFSFLFGKKSDQRLKDLVHVWWLPFLYLGVNILCLYAGGAFISFLFRFRFGNTESWTLAPRLALAGKLVISWFFITVVISFNQLIRFPEDNFIYGYIASVICLVNLFIFSSLDFSLSLLFLSVYFISFAVYHVRRPLAQIAGILLLFLPFLPYIRALAEGGPAAILPLYTGAGAWNVLMALFAMPFQLLVSRFFHTVGVFGRKTKFYLPINLVLIFIAGILFTALLLFFPAWSVRNPLTVSLRQTVEETGSRLDIRTPVELSNIAVTNDEKLAASPGLPADPAMILRLRTSSRKFLERRLVSVSIDPSLDAAKIRVTVTSANGLSVYDASLPYELRKAGQESVFDSGEDPDIPYVFTFSSDLDSDLTVTARMWTRGNPWGVTVANKDLAADYLLEVVQSAEVDAPGASSGETR